ncbi:FusB/FusC family EF-G-binding protein (plasmid) [Pseudalkalibacillus hwajinpoensis]|uniref:FusB/FusC family EF-G-binding protein n=1 Tax=Guptibacillus hwajinpoensis TaxID=208199 RepID=UPI00325A9FE2
MQPFIYPHQYHYLKSQVYKLIKARVSSTDKNVINAVKGLVEDNITSDFAHCSAEEQKKFAKAASVKDEREAESYLEDLKTYVIPFNISEKEIKKLFPKVKKLKIPDLNQFDKRELTYLTWWDAATHRKFIVTRKDGKPYGVEGTFTNSSQKGVCSVCNQLAPVGLFLVKKKGKEIGTYKKKGNYICAEGDGCNQNITSSKNLEDFIARLSK